MLRSLRSARRLASRALHQAGAVVGTLGALVGLVAEQAHLLRPETAARVAAAGAVLAGLGKALPILEQAVAGDGDALAPEAP